MPEEKRVEEEEREWIRRMASKDADALDALYRRYSRVAFGLVLRIVGNREDAEDVLTDVFWQAWQQAGRYDFTRGNPAAWLLTIARTRAIDRIRSTGRKQQQTYGLDEQRELPVSPQPDPFVLSGTRTAVQQALQTLPEQQRILLEMAYFEGMSHTEIAGNLGLPLGTVKDRIRTAMMHLRQRLKSYL